MKGIERQAEWKGRGYKPGKMDEFIRDNLKTTRNMDKVNSPQQMAVDTKEVGRMEGSTEREHSMERMARW